jgi:hypothetical protein
MTPKSMTTLRLNMPDRLALTVLAVLAAISATTQKPSQGCARTHTSRTRSLHVRAIGGERRHP